MSKVIVTKSKIDDVNDELSTAIGTSTNRTLANMKAAAQGINTTISYQSDLLDAAIEALQTKAAGATSLITGSQENEYAKDYIDEVEYVNETAYDAADYADSDIAEYVNAVPQGTDGSKPLALTLPVVAGELVLSDKAAGLIRRETISATANKSVYNLTPNALSLYAILLGDGIVKTGALKPTGTLRMINTAQTQNVRDLGGWACDGGTIKYGKIFRGAEPQTADIGVLHDEIGIRWELNVRGIAEATQAAQNAGREVGTIIGKDVEFTLPERDCTYSIVDTEMWKEQFTAIFAAVDKGKPLYIHCAAGADRTGTTIALIEAILGVCQSDIDKDYELTSFNTGVDTDAHARRRNENEWKSFISAVWGLTRGSTFRDKVLWWIASMGFTDAQINAFRAAMIDGTPDTISLNRNTYTLTKQLTNVSVDSENTQAPEEYLPYIAEISADDGYVIDSISVLMGNTDITNSVFTGRESNRYYSVTKTPTNCTISGNNYAGEGGAYTATITADAGYALSSVIITMGETDVSTYYSNGTINIPAVNGNITITATAVASAPQTVTLVFKDGYNCDKTVGSPLNVRAGADYCITELFDVSSGKTVTLAYDGSVSTNNIYFVGVDSNGNVTEVSQQTFDSGHTPVSYTVTNASTVKMCLRGYHSSFPAFDGHVTATLSD